ncbi:MAG: glycosyltransferase [Fibrobacter sp.]|jgi:alpha-1,6-mannosyltransferase|nr:glycosyltransferase [Fibrobacter sp.]
MSQRTTIVDFNNFWSPSGGGVRRYHLERMKFYENRSDTLLVFAMPDSRTYTEVISHSLVIEHIKAFRFRGKWEYRFIWKQSSIRPVLKKYQPDIIEVGSPYILPQAVRKAAKKVSPQSKFTAFWHADFPVTYVRRYFEKWHLRFIAPVMEKLAFAYARKSFKGYSLIQVSSREIMERLEKNMKNTFAWIPLGCDIETFNPNHADPELTQELKAGEPERLTAFFPHRFCDEKGLHLLLKAYPLISKALGTEPAIIFAGTGPDLPEVEEAVKQYKHICYKGFLTSTKMMARFYASVEIGFALSGWETFGLSILESMASGNALVSAPTGAAAEHARESRAGVLIEKYTPEALCEAVVKLTQSNLREKQKKARAYAEKFSWVTCFERQLAAYYTQIHMNPEDAHD